MAAKTAAAPRPGGKKNAADEERGPTTEERFAAFSARYKWYLFVPLLAAIVLALFVSDAVAFVLALMAQLKGVVNSLGWSTVAIYLLLALGFAYFLFAKPSES